MNKNKVVAYEVYVRSFNDSNDDGIGDIRGITQKLDYLQELGINFIWLTPIFTSPQRDNGYDVSNYMEINPLFRTMDDFKELVREAKTRGMSIMLDFVFNHTSIEHEWFQKAISGNKDFQDYYFFSNNEFIPSNWDSKFGFKAWRKLNDKTWYLALYDITQADLNYSNPKIIEELAKVLIFWKDLGVKGFRFDVINVIDKTRGIVKEGNQVKWINDKDDCKGDCGKEFYTNGPKVLEYVKELFKKANITDDHLTIGELSAATIKAATSYTKQGGLDLFFNFHHLKVDYKNNKKWVLDTFKPRKLFNSLIEWQKGVEKENSNMALFLSNHDQPRVISRFGNDNKYHFQSATALAKLYMFLKGTPFLYFGEEIGMTNNYYSDIKDYYDIESLNYYKMQARKENFSKENALNILCQRSRDNSRSPMSWNSDGSEFSQGKPWIRYSKNQTRVNLKQDLKNENSVFRWYKEIINFRKNNDEINSGKIRFIKSECDSIFCYQRYNEKNSKLIIINLDSKTNNIDDKIVKLITNKKIALNNYKSFDSSTLKPYQAVTIEL